MATDTFFSLACSGIIAMIFGLVLTFAGYRFFIFLLPIWGFFFGLYFGAQTIQALFGQGFMGTVTSWVVGFIVGAIFAVLSYAVYYVAVAIIAGSLGYVLAVNILTWIGLHFGFLVWLIGIVAAVLVAIIAIAFNWQKYVVIAATAILGSGIITGTITLLFNPSLRFLDNPIATAIGTSPFLIILFLGLAVFGFIFQYTSTRTLEAKTFYHLGATEHPQ